MPNFSSEEVQNATIIHCTVHLNDKIGPEFVPILKEAVEKAAAIDNYPVILDMKSSSCEKSFFRILTPVIMEARKKHPNAHWIKRVFAIHVVRECAMFIKDNAMDGIIEVLPNLEAVRAKMQLTEKKPKSTGVDVAFINPFLEATVKTFKVQCSTDCKGGKPVIKSKAFELPINIAAVIGITSKAFSGSIAICFPEKTFLKIMGNMLSETYTEVTQDIEDGAGELLNIIFGQAKIVLNEKGYSIEKAIPTIIRGKELSVSQMTTNPVITIPFESNAGNFSIEIAREGAM